MKNAYDIIGDIHGHLDKLEALLQKMDYVKKGNSYHHPDRQVIFVGDYIDRGPDNPGVVKLVRNMVDSEDAIAIMGNHEYNAVLYNTPNGMGDYLRPHSEKNNKQHAVTLKQYEGRKDEYTAAIHWFKTLPLYFENEQIRIVHACWNTEQIAYLHQQTTNGVLSDEQFRLSADKASPLYNAVEITCKGIETDLPEGVSFTDKDGTVRKEIRLKWWENPLGKSFKEMSVVQNIEMHHQDFNVEVDYYFPNEKPVFFGHYWLNGNPELLKSNVCCLDYSVAKGGKLCAYRWSGENQLENKNIVYV